MRTRHFNSALLAVVALVAISSIIEVAGIWPTSTTRVNNLEITGTTDATGVMTARAGTRLTTLTTGPLLTSGNGDPNGVVTATIGSLYLRTSNGTLYQNTDGATTWAFAGGVSDGDKGDITVTVSGTVWTIDPAVVSLAKMADLAQSTMIGRAAGAGIGVPTALTSAQATAILDAFTAIAKGLAPASGGGTSNFLRADGTWAAPTGLTGTDPVFGYGTDGDANFDCVNPVHGIAPSGSTYSLSRNFYFDDVTVVGGCTIHMNGWYIVATGTLTGGGRLTDLAFAGGNGTGAAGGAGGPARGVVWFGGNAAGGNGTMGVGGNASSSTAAPLPWFPTAGTNAGGAAPGGNGTTAVNAGGGGGGGAGGPNGGGTGGGITAVSATTAGWTPEALQRGRGGVGFATVITWGAGGGGGGGAAGVGGGGGGASGGITYVAARTIGTITIDSNGGNGGNGFAGTAGVRGGGGGGGGGGGVVIAIYETVAGALTLTADGGTGGTGGADNGAGAGGNGGNGGPGQVLRFNLSGDGT